VAFRSFLAAVVTVQIFASARPAPAGEDPVPRCVRTNTIDIFHRVAKSADAAFVEVWVTTDYGATWAPAGEDREFTGRLTFKAPAQGTYGFVAAAVPKGGKAGRPPAPGTAPTEVVVADWTAPAGRPLRPVTSGSLDVEIAYELRDQGPAGVASAALWQTEDGGRVWRKLADLVPAEAAVKARLPRQGVFGLAISAADQSGNILPPPGPGQIPVFTLLCDTDRPRLKIVGPREGAVFPGGGVVPIEWAAEDDHFGDAPITVECSTDGGNSWEKAGPGVANTGRLEWRAPRIDSARCLVRVTAVDKVGNESREVSRPFAVDSTAPSTRPVPPAQLPPVQPAQPVPPAPDVPPVSIRRLPPPPEPSEAELLAAARGHLDAGRRADAAAAAGKILAAKADSVDARMIRARALLESDPAAAAADLEAVLGLAPDAAGLCELLGDAHYRLGTAALQRGDQAAAGRELGRAAEAFRRARAGRPGSWVLSYNLALTLIGLARTEAKPGAAREEARQQLARALELVDVRDLASRADIAWYRAVLTEDEGKLAEAAFLFRKAADLFGPESPSGRAALENARRVERRR